MSQPYPPPAGQYQPAPVPQGPPAMRCRFCGSVPAVQTKFRGHQGMIVIMRFLSLEGPFCRDCGMATFRSMTSKTLIQGWYGYASLVIAPITVLMNIFKRDKVASLGAPHDGVRPPMDPGKRLLARPASIIGLCIPILIIAVIIWAIVTSDPGTDYSG